MSTAPMRIKATLKDGVVDLRVLARHVMESGERKDAAGKLIPAHYIRHFTILHKDRMVVDSQFGPAVSKDPLIQVKFKGAALGDKVTVKWTDTAGQSRGDEAVVA